ncbi:histidine--tRNA ligase [Nafulsella turpanensis]|uniref:histidine--tRNA ligase n=1 Tax=Nafulsella turpanensis TaxID=1265690 RepID=UPI0004771C10|nr:histidine--tRNA ligase [Nafulsella turpanensis]
MAQKPSIPKGTRDFGPLQMARRNYIFNTIRHTFEKFGYMPLETPSMENLSVLTGKYGDEGDQLLFKILNSGDFLKKTSEADYREGSKQLLPLIAEKGLRYDLTVPFARYVVMNQNDITFPFKRYQIQPVWRADRPQRGRYREFYQCDADVIGTDSLICEAEIVLMITEVFEKLNLKDYIIKINNRKVLTGITEVIGAAGREADFCVAIDKLDKIGHEGVFKELGEKGFSGEAIEKLQPLLALQEAGDSSLDALQQLLESSTTGLKGVKELQAVFELLKAFGAQPKLELDLTLARGLSYYTGAIFEVKPTSVQMGSISGGGRYDDLTGVFGLPGMSGVGFSFGVDRVYDVLEELNLFPEESTVSTQAMLVNFGEKTLSEGLQLLGKLRAAGIRAEIYPEEAKMKKQLAYANKKNIPYVILQGEEEIAKGEITLKNMMSGQQENVNIPAAIQQILS